MSHGRRSRRERQEEYGQDPPPQASYGNPYQQQQYFQPTPYRMHYPPRPSYPAYGQAYGYGYGTPPPPPPPPTAVVRPPYRAAQPPQTTQARIPKKWNLFPHRFLNAYRAPDEFEEDADYLGVLEPYNCEWFARPSMALSMLSQTITECVPVVEGHSSSVFDRHMVDTMTNELVQITPVLAKFNNKDKHREPPTGKDVRAFLKFAVEENPQFDEALNSCIEGASAMLTLATQIKAAKVLCRNPEEYAAKCSSSSNAHQQFAEDAHMRSLEQWMTMDAIPVPSRRRGNLAQELEQEPPRAPPRRRRDLVAELRGSDEEEQEEVRRPRRTTTRRVPSTPRHTATTREEEARRSGVRKRTTPQRSRAMVAVDEESAHSNEDEEDQPLLPQGKTASRTPCPAVHTATKTETLLDVQGEDEQVQESDEEEEEEEDEQPISKTRSRIPSIPGNTTSTQEEDSRRSFKRSNTHPSQDILAEEDADSSSARPKRKKGKK